MTSRIQTLPIELVHLIAAGEVIDSLAAVVRELAENALDAGATRITVAVGVEQWQIRVTDNGEGMSLNDLQQAATSHSTSKIQDSQDLWRIQSLGFRGEALHGLAQLADLEICSRAIGQDEGWRVVYDHQGNPAQTETVAIAPGTIVTVSDLFGQWIPRRQASPASAQQLRAVQRVIQQLALCHPHVTWQVQQAQREWFTIAAGASAQQILPQVLPGVQVSDLRAARPIKEVNLLLGLPDRCHRRRPDWVKVAVNGRVVSVPELEQTLLQGLRRTVPRDRYPVCFLHLHLSPDQVDWNRHPAKAEIYLHQLESWQQQVLKAIDQALQLDTNSLPDAAHAPRIDNLIKAAETQGSYGVASSQTTPFAPLRALTQVHNMYILAEHPTGMWLIEQHIAHERVLYEQLCDHWQLVTLAPPVILNQLSEAQIEQLQRIGVEVESFGDRLWAARTAPASLAQREDCAEALIELSLGGNLEAALVATACRTAIRNGTPLTHEEMQTLLEQWQQTRNPRTCPHGRPIYLPLEESRLSRFFRRHWVIGKSHGI
jgi:DNA mismatch repair protein MutL